VGPEGSAIAGLWFLEALSIPAAVADVMSAHLGDGIHLYRHGVISYANQPARDRGVECGMTVADAAERLLEHDAPTHRAAADITNRTIMYSDGDRHVIATDSIAFALPEDRDRNVLVTAGHTGRSAVPYLLQAQPHGFICSDGGRGMDDSGIVGLVMVETHGLAGATMAWQAQPLMPGMRGWAQECPTITTVSFQRRMCMRLHAGFAWVCPVVKQLGSSFSTHETRSIRMASPALRSCD